MARKSKGFGELLNQHQRTKGQQESMNKLAKRVQQNLQGKVEKVMFSQPGEVKMSDVLEAFVSPYLETAHSHNQ
jgi:hypothetical protein